MLVSTISHDRIAAPAPPLRDPLLRVGLPVLGLHLPGHSHRRRAHPSRLDVWHTILHCRHINACLLRPPRTCRPLPPYPAASHGRRRNSVAHVRKSHPLVCRTNRALGILGTHGFQHPTVFSGARFASPRPSQDFLSRIG